MRAQKRRAFGLSAGAGPHYSGRYYSGRRHWTFLSGLRLYPVFGESPKPLGEAFINLVKLIIANVVRPVAGMNVDPATLDSSAVADYVSKFHDQSIAAFSLKAIRKTFGGAFGEGEI